MKLIITYFIRIIMRIFWIFPLKDKTVLTSYNGRQFSCNPKYIAIALAEQNKEVYFALNNTKISIPKGIKKIKYRSIKHYYHLMTAKFIVINSSGITGLLPYRKKQVIINTWHGGGYFKVMGNDFMGKKQQLRMRNISGNSTSIFLASCEAFAKQLPKSMSITKNKIFKTGMPRNDILFKNNIKIREKICIKYKINPQKGIILYAPTYRDGIIASVNNSGYSQIDSNAVMRALKSRFNKDYVFLFRAHHNMIPENLSPNCINVTDYDDMQELLAASDVLITDYSSCMWDFSLQKKPGFLYTPDLKIYESKHPFGTKTKDWPYPICKTNKDLIDKILKYNDAINRKKISDYQKIVQSFEDGHATEKIIKLMHA